MSAGIISLVVVFVCAWSAVCVMYGASLAPAPQSQPGLWDDEDEWDDEDHDGPWVLVEFDDGDQMYLPQRAADFGAEPGAWFVYKTPGGDQVMGRIVAYGNDPHSEHEVLPIETGGETVAYLCVTCDAQLPADWRQ